MTDRERDEALDDEAATRLETLAEGGADEADGPSTADEALEIGHFRLIRELGSGGMGRVFLAQQLEPVDRQVALKVIRKRVLNRRTLARFEVELQVLAQMQHPAIAQVHDAGTTPQGYPWFAMEYVDGEPLDQYCARHRLQSDDRLDLFMRICQGVQHAHQRGIIHRDLKPANILVTTVDGVPQPKIIDFGIATAARADEDESVTARDMAGTPEYMSPEQFADGDGIIDTRSDVYSLGVVLYELLVDEPPIDRRHFRSQERPEFSSLPHGGTAPSPSSRLAESHERREEIARKRATRFRRLHKYLRGDLDAIALKTLDPEREQRYATPAELADDIARYRACKPVRAREWTLGYRAGKFMRRHALALGSASAVLLALLAGLTAATIGMFEAQRQYQIAQTRSLELEQVAAFQQSMLEEIDPAMMGFGILDILRRQVGSGLEQSDTSGASTGNDMAGFESYLAHTNASDLAREVVDEHILQRALVSTDRDFANQPLLQADLLQAVFEVYRAVGQAQDLPELGERIVALRESELPDNHLDVLDARRLLARAWFARAEYDYAVDLLEGVIESLDDAQPEERRLMAQAIDELAMVLVERGEGERAIELASENIDRYASALRINEHERLDAYGTMGYVLARSGNIESALGYFQRQLDGYRQLPAADDAATARIMINVSAALGGLRRLEESLEVNRAAVELLENSLGRRHPITLRAMANLANTMHRLGQSSEAIVLLEDAVELRGEVMGPQHPLTLRAMLNLASVYTNQDQHDRALELIEVVAQQRSLQLGDEHLDTLMARELLANVHLNRGDAETSLSIIEPVHHARLEILGDDHDLTQDSAYLLGQSLLDTGDAATALPILESSLEHSRERIGPEGGTTLRNALAYYQALIELEDIEGARKARERHFALFEDVDADEMDDRRSALYREFIDLQRREQALDR
jgi:eukaryotic-like serine/threonine-protein kinase